MLKLLRTLATLWPWAIVLAQPVMAGELTRQQLEGRFHSPLRVQEKLADLPAWPITSELEPEGGPVGYVFESNDLAPLPGFAGKPINLLISIDRQGKFIEVEVLRHREPIFLHTLGEAPLEEFVRQYAGKNVKQEISIAAGNSSQRNSLPSPSENQVVLDGVTRATTSVRIINQTVLASAMAIARAKMGLTDRVARPPARPRSDPVEKLNFAEMLERDMVARLRVSNAQAEAIFAGTDGARADEDGLAEPTGTLVDLYVAYLNSPTIGRSLLGEVNYTRLMEKLEAGQQAFWIATAGRYSMMDDAFVPAGIPSRLALNQDGLPLELRDLVFEEPAPAGAPALNASRVFTVFSGAGIDPGRPMKLTLTLTRTTRKGQILPRTILQPVAIEYAPPEELFMYPPRPLPEWLQAWKARWLDLAIIGTALAILSVALFRPRALSIAPRRLAAFRWLFLAFTLFYLGWYAQGQLSIVQIIGALQSLAAGQGLSNFLYDPISLLLLGFTIATLFVWGRGTFCGWLCPFGALQEIVHLVARRLSLPRLRLPPPVVRRLEAVPYVILAVLVVTALTLPQLGEALVEVEPFKTVITVGFDRSWPFVFYAVLLIVAGALYFKAFCRFLCPLGATLTLGGKARRLAWLPRRSECGRPCQSCRALCEYDAIEPDGAIRYDKCFQCLDCVGMYHDNNRCAPILLFAKKGLVMTPGGVRLGKQ